VTNQILIAICLINGVVFVAQATRERTPLHKAIVVLFGVFFLFAFAWAVTGAKP